MQINTSINAKTKLYGLIGNSVEHSISPYLHNTLASIYGHNISYTAFKVEESDLKSVIDAAYKLKLQGFNITVPYKEAIMKELVHIDDLAKRIGSVNTIKWTEQGYFGYNTDALGILKSLELNDIKIKDSTVIIIGAGGAAKAIANSILMQNPKKVYIANRTIDKATALIENVGKYYDIPIKSVLLEDISDITEMIDICIQTTSVGMYPNVDNSVVSGCKLFSKCRNVIDIVYNPKKTKFLSDAENMGCKIINGLGMLVFQGIMSYEIWHDIKVDNDIARDILCDIERYV
ncbi:MAG: shikimate dehydrogenase [Clostridiales bacterium GWE2_32_10]|nr:MAG: shikimate dehydrogenase [Clostridiales bacterium GWE2_32_10]HBY21711.1 shikimate dehydrogenase [Clostridiales bacterium]